MTTNNHREAPKASIKIHHRLARSKFALGISTLLIAVTGGMYLLLSTKAAVVYTTDPIHRAQCIEVTPSKRTVLPNETFTARVQIKNVGSSSFSSSYGFFFGEAHEPPAIWNATGTNVPLNVSPSGTAVFNLGLRAPASSGSYNFNWGIGIALAGFVPDICTAPNIIVTNPPTVSLKANNSDNISLVKGSALTLSWSTANNPVSCTASGAWTGAKGLSGAENRTADTATVGTKTYTLSCSNGVGSSSSTRTVTVTNPAPSPVPAPAPAPTAQPSKPTSTTGSSTPKASSNKASTSGKVAAPPPLSANPTPPPMPGANPTATTTYTVIVTDNNSCSKDAQVTITVNSLPLVTAGNAVAICLDKSVTLNAGGAVNYSWSPTTGLSDPLIANPVASPTATTVYTVIGTDANSCSASSSVQVTVNPLPVAVASADTTICDFNTISLNSSGGQTYSWSPVTGLSNASIANPSATPHTTTTYTVTVTDGNGCTDTEDVLVDVNPQPKSDFDIDPSKTIGNCDGVTATFVNNSSDALSYLWDLGFAFTTVETEPTHTFQFGGDATIRLISYNNFCTDTLYRTFHMGNVSDFLDSVPNTFTPNDDGVNDCFNLGAHNKFYGCSNWVIFSRWGEKIYTSKSQDDCWNGKRESDGADMPAGTYFFLVKIFDSVKQGTLLLTR